MNTWHTIAAPATGQYKERGSRFLAFAYPVTSEAEIAERLAYLRKEYYDARHHCYAYRIGTKEPHVRAYDDGEPSHSAGDPILGQIRSFELTNVLVVVVRYFGGTKLGVGGLVQAYKTATEEALRLAVRLVLVEKVRFSIRFTYEQTAHLQRTLGEFPVEYLNRVYEADCQLDCELPKEEWNRLKEKLVGYEVKLHLPN